jgi:hypothetical protein
LLEALWDENFGISRFFSLNDGRSRVEHDDIMTKILVLIAQVYQLAPWYLRVMRCKPLLLNLDFFANYLYESTSHTALLDKLLRGQAIDVLEGLDDVLAEGLLSKLQMWRVQLDSGCS